MHDASNSALIIALAQVSEEAASKAVTTGASRRLKRGSLSRQILLLYRTD